MCSSDLDATTKEKSELFGGIGQVIFYIFSFELLAFKFSLIYIYRMQIEYDIPQAMVCQSGISFMTKFVLVKNMTDGVILGNKRGVSYRLLEIRLLGTDIPEWVRKVK